MESIPAVTLNADCRPMPLLGMGTAAYPFGPEETKSAILHAIELGYRHFDTASLYQSEQPLGEAIAEALQLGLIVSRADLFVTSKLWCNDAHPDLVLPALQTTLRNLQLEYLDLYLIHWPASLKPGSCLFPINEEDLLPLDIKGVWQVMEECQRLGLTRAIGVSNFSCNNIQELLTHAKIPPAVNQVEMHTAWQQKKLREFCGEKGIHVTAYSPLGGQNDPSKNRNYVMESEVLQEIAKARVKTLAQVALRWVHEQGVSIVVKSFNKERIKENMHIFDWELTNEDCSLISRIPQCKKITTKSILTVTAIWDPLKESTDDDV